MRKFTPLLSGLYHGFASYVEPNKVYSQIGEDSNKEPPGIKTVDLAYLNCADLIIANDGTKNYSISSMQMGKGSLKEMSDDVENITTTHIKKQNQHVGYKTNYPDMI